MFLLLSLFISCVCTYCTVVLLYCCIITNALHTYVDCDWFYICKDLRKGNKYDMISVLKYRDCETNNILRDVKGFVTFFGKETNTTWW